MSTKHPIKEPIASPSVSPEECHKPNQEFHKMMFEKHRALNKNRYYLGNNYPGKYFSAQEALCMYCLLQNHSYKDIAVALGLSERTITFYCHQMRAKISCASKTELVERVKETGFTDYFSELEAILQNLKFSED
ncbi:MAG: helix-turn-helix transcriptional regulator [Gammaproteobacteria bacterium]